MRTIRTTCVAALVAAAAAICPIAAAQDGPPTPKLSTAPSPLMGYAIVAILGGIIIAISLYPSKRQHTDL